MSAIQYIGARYAPKFFGEWDEKLSYEPLTVVISPEYSTYTSKCYVPKYTKLTDTKYWIETGVYNAQLAEYRAKVLDLDSRMSNYFPSELKALEEAIAIANARLAELANKISVLEGQGVS